MFEKFRSLFSFLFFLFSFLFFIFIFFLSLGGPFSYGAPGHCPPMPPSRYATVNRQSYNFDLNSAIFHFAGMMILNPLIYLMITHWGWRNMLRVIATMIILIGVPCICTFIPPCDDNPLSSSRDDTQVQSSNETKVKSKEKRLSRRQSQASAIFDKKPMSEELRVLLFPESVRNR